MRTTVFLKLEEYYTSAQNRVVLTFLFTGNRHPFPAPPPPPIYVKIQVSFLEMHSKIVFCDSFLSGLFCSEGGFGCC